MTMKTSIFDDAYEELIEYEGVYSNIKLDAGGETVFGISRVNWPYLEIWSLIDEHRSRGRESMMELIYSESFRKKVKAFYYINFWKLMCGNLLEGLDTALAHDMFEMSVNLGTRRTIKYFQRALNVLNRNQDIYPDIKVDGVFGDKTINTLKSAIRYRGVELVYKVLNLFQGMHYIGRMERQKSQEIFIGWFKRVTFHPKSTGVGRK